MSVAFRRDGDEEHLEPKFEVPIPPGPNLVTAAGMTLIEERIEALDARIATISDETTLAAARRDLRYWRNRLATAELQSTPTGSTVQFGSRVRFTLNGKPREIVIVGHDEADPARNRLAFTAPLARALLGGEAGDITDFGGCEDAIEIVEVTPA
ncbi:GreA/GreB family elongation factor [Novosphingobium panipatense]|uniref:Transcription elongation factor, GreA/GreB family n=1 Tax=Novosphingobium panipatense TaxID=428991 RepID=A0ABY1Q2N6_9SPHN|nr:GreA/GreB family elongation factor [Novosphingobium panipatense]SMP57268.1 Transcription elongation factor, GreA/GreB family [Novosphingobium panipatense]